MEIRCGHCSQFVGDAPDEMEFVGMFKEPRDRLCLPEPRGTWRCGKCGWATVFRPKKKALGGWRHVEAKAASA